MHALVRTLTVAFLAASAVAEAEDLPLLENIVLLDLEGREVRLADRAKTKPLVVAYTGVGCPISNKYAPRLNAFAERFAGQGVRFLGVNASPQDSREKIAKELRELGLEIEVLKDFRQELTKALEAKTTTEVFVFDEQGKLRYRGAIDDQYSLGAAKPAPTKHYLASALESVLAGREPDPATTDAPGCLLTVLPEEELPEAITWSRHIAPLLQEKCETCHRPGQAAPFALQTYEQARGWAEMIAAVVEEGRMPPWNATASYDGVFVNERRLGPADRKRLFAWVESGMPRGNPLEDPKPKAWPEGWTIGEPDAIFTMERDLRRREPIPAAGYRVPREGVVDYEYFAVDTEFTEDRWIRAVETRPGAADVVHHILVWADDPENGKDVTRSRGAFKSYLAAGVPGEISTTYPAGYGKRLPAGARLVFQLHYTPNGKERFDRSSVGFVFWDEPPDFEVVTDAVVDDEFVIPPGATNHEVRASQTLFQDTGLIALMPHMHTRGKDFRYIAHFPDGAHEELLAVNFDFNWQESYVLPDPYFLPNGTRLECIGHFDNSADNPNNPDPTLEVEWGDQTFEEMFIGYYDYVRPVE